MIAAALCAAVVLGAAVVVVTSRDLVRAVLALGVVLAGTAALYGILDAPTMAATQLLLYVGGVVTILVFGVLLTRSAKLERGRVILPLSCALGLAGALGVGIFRTSLPAAMPAQDGAQAVGARFVTEHLLALEVLSALLLAAMVGAIVLGRRRDAGEAP